GGRAARHAAGGAGPRSGHPRPDPGAGSQLRLRAARDGLPGGHRGGAGALHPPGPGPAAGRGGRRGPPRVAPVTILIADIRGFTTLAEPLGPHEAVALLNDYFATIVAPLAAEGAVLDKYLGDGLLAFLEG